MFWVADTHSGDMLGTVWWVWRKCLASSEGTCEASEMRETSEMRDTRVRARPRSSMARTRMPRS